MKRVSFLIIYLFPVLFIYSCSKSTCLNQGIIVTFNGFDTTALTNIIVEQYKSNSNFSTLLSVNFSDTTDTMIYQSNDTLFSLPKTLSSSIAISAGYDYKIILPYQQRTFKISNIAYHQASRHFSNSGSGGCTNDVSYYLDSIPHTFTGASYNQVYPPPVNIVLNN